MAKKNRLKYVVLDNELNAMIVNGMIYRKNLEKGWNAIKGLVTAKRLKRFLRDKGIKLHEKCREFIYAMNKRLSVQLTDECFA